MGKQRQTEVSREFLLRLLAEAYAGRAWHGPNLRGAIRGLTAQQACKRPRPDRRCIAEIVVHCAYWKYAIRRRLLGEKPGAFPLAGHNWFALPAPFTPRRWKECIELLASQHRRLIEAVESLPQVRLSERGSHPGRSPLHQIYGMAFHDTYHAGQIRTIRGLIALRVPRKSS